MIPARGQNSITRRGCLWKKRHIQIRHVDKNTVLVQPFHVQLGLWRSDGGAFHIVTRLDPIPRRPSIGDKLVRESIMHALLQPSEPLEEFMEDYRDAVSRNDVAALVEAY